MKFEKTSIVKCPEGIQLHHIFAKGTNEEIGYQLGRLANDFHNIDKSANINASIVESQYSYLKKLYPEHYARMSGFAKAYKKRLNDYSYDFSFFGNALNGPACSAVYYPPAITISNRGYIIRILISPSRRILNLIHLIFHFSIPIYWKCIPNHPIHLFHYSVLRYLV